jgi:hypothetical protein
MRRVKVRTRRAAPSAPLHVRLGVRRVGQVPFGARRWPARGLPRAGSRGRAGRDVRRLRVRLDGSHTIAPSTDRPTQQPPHSPQLILLIEKTTTPVPCDAGVTRIVRAGRDSNSLRDLARRRELDSPSWRAQNGVPARFSELGDPHLRLTHLTCISVAIYSHSAPPHPLARIISGRHPRDA